MAFKPPPSFWGFITIDSTNNEIKFSETNGTTPSTRTATIADGQYFPDSVLVSESLASQIATAMTAASLYGATYTCTVDKTDGTVTIAGSGGTMTGFYLMLTTTETSKLLTGGDVAVGLQGVEQFGWVVDSGYPGYATSSVSDNQVSCAWHPQGPVANTTPIAGKDHQYSAMVSQVTTIGNKTVTRCFTPRVSPSDTNYSEVIPIEFQYLTDTDRDTFVRFFYAAYAQTGAKVRYFHDRADLIIYDEVLLWQESVSSFAPSRLSGYRHFNVTIKFKRWKE